MKLKCAGFLPGFSLKRAHRSIKARTKKLIISHSFLLNRPQPKARTRKPMKIHKESLVAQRVETFSGSAPYFEVKPSLRAIVFDEPLSSMVVPSISYHVFPTFLEKIVKVTQINCGSRNQLHNSGSACQILNFGLSWPGQGKSVKAKHCQSMKLSLLCTDTALSQPSIGAQYPKQNMIKFSQCLAELAQKLKKN